MVTNHGTLVLSESVHLNAFFPFVNVKKVKCFEIFELGFELTFS